MDAEIGNQDDHRLAEKVEGLRRTLFILDALVFVV